MTREIKVRGRHVDNGEWVYGYLIGQDVIVGSIVEWDSEYFNTEFWYKVNPETVGQYTGLKDRNGKEIYEGDILQDDNGVGEVEWVQEHCAFMVFTRNPSTYHRLESDGSLTSTTVIGNIHPNPDLLEVSP
ncbi:YopX family protein [Paenibacillus filicis]|uniref:YopX family protein n=1 Tax=Paenibacillus filicis TaxID=669464 RepID=A0ABU9DYF1_9BACL